MVEESGVVTNTTIQTYTRNDIFSIGVIILILFFGSILLNQVFKIPFFKSDNNVEPTPIVCEDNQSPFNGTCYEKLVDCDVENGSGQKTREGSLYSDCKVIGCEKRYKNVENKCISDIPEQPRSYIDYIKENGKEGEDYIVINPIKPQPRIVSKVGEENTDRIHLYIENNKDAHTRTIPSEVDGGYIMFETTRELKVTSKLFLGIGYQTRGVIDQSKSFAPYAGNEYIYDISNIPLTPSGEGRSFIINLLSIAKEQNGKLSITGVTSEDENEVVSIIIVFKK